METTRICKGCERELPLTPDYFHRDYKCGGGLKYKCKECTREIFRTLHKNKKKRKRIKYKKPVVDFNIDSYQDIEIIKKFKKLYLEDALPFYKIRRITNLSVGNVHFLLDVLGIRLSRDELTKVRKNNRIKKWQKLMPTKEVLENQYKECDYSMHRVFIKFYSKIPYNIVSNWFKELKIERRAVIRYQSPEDRLNKIIKNLKINKK